MRFSSNSDEVFFELVIFGIVLSCFLLLKTITIGCVGFYCLIQWRKKFGSDWELFLSTCFDKNRWFFWFQIHRQNYLLFLGFYWLFGVVLFGLVQDGPCFRMLSTHVSGPTLGLLFPCVGGGNSPFRCHLVPHFFTVIFGIVDPCFRTNTGSFVSLRWMDLLNAIRCYFYNIWVISVDKKMFFTSTNFFKYMRFSISNFVHLTPCGSYLLFLGFYCCHHLWTPPLRNCFHLFYVTRNENQFL